MSVFLMNDLLFMCSPTRPDAPTSKEFKVAVSHVITALPSVASFCQPATVGESAAGFFGYSLLDFDARRHRSCDHRIINRN